MATVNATAILEVADSLAAWADDEHSSDRLGKYAEKLRQAVPAGVRYGGKVHDDGSVSLAEGLSELLPTESIRRRRWRGKDRAGAKRHMAELVSDYADAGMDKEAIRAAVSEDLESTFSGNAIMDLFRELLHNFLDRLIDLFLARVGGNA